MVFDIQEILATIPHRYPFVLIDRVLAFESRKSITAIKNVTINEPFFQGHFPQEKVFPGVLMLEAMAQALAVLALQSLKHEGKDYQDAQCYYAGVDKVRFRRKIIPGDTMKIEVELTRAKGKMLKADATITVEGEIACVAEIMAFNSIE